MLKNVEKLFTVLTSFSAYDAVDLVALFVLFFCFFSVAKKYNSSYFIYVSCLLVVLAAVLKIVGAEVSSTIVMMVVVLLPLYFIILFKNEMKREIWKRSSFNAHGELIISRYSGTETEVRACINTIIKAVQNLSKVNVGALIVIVPNTIPAQITESGTRLNADISNEVIENIFTPNTPLHDGAMLISGNKIMAAGCFLPLAQDNDIPKELGTRHRAALGISDMCDVLAIVVSEETGIISVARRGKLKRYLDGAALMNELEVVYGIRTDYEAEEEDKQ